MSQIHVIGAEIVQGRSGANIGRRAYRGAPVTGEMKDFREEFIQIMDEFAGERGHIHRANIKVCSL